jgi:Ni,Fe-hydrogenase I cytochrome b subunit
MLLGYINRMFLELFRTKSYIEDINMRVKWSLAYNERYPLLLPINAISEHLRLFGVILCIISSIYDFVLNNSKNILFI